MGVGRYCDLPVSVATCSISRRTLTSRLEWLENEERVKALGWYWQGLGFEVDPKTSPRSRSRNDPRRGSGEATAVPASIADGSLRAPRSLLSVARDGVRVWAHAGPLRRRHGRRKEGNSVVGSPATVLREVGQGRELPGHRFAARDLRFVVAQPGSSCLACRSPTTSRSAGPRRRAPRTLPSRTSALWHSTVLKLRAGAAARTFPCCRTRLPKSRRRCAISACTTGPRASSDPRPPKSYRPSLRNSVADPVCSYVRLCGRSAGEFSEAGIRGHLPAHGVRPRANANPQRSELKVLRNERRCIHQGETTGCSSSDGGTSVSKPVAGPPVVRLAKVRRWISMFALRRGAVGLFRRTAPSRPTCRV